MTFRQLAEQHGFGHLKAVAPIKPAPTQTVTAERYVTVKDGKYSASVKWCSSLSRVWVRRTWT